MTAKMSIQLHFGEGSLDHVLRAIEKAATDLERRGAVARADMVISFEGGGVTISGPQAAVARG